MHLFPAGAGQVVSIHAPAWGATTGHMPAIQDSPVSIHAPAWGATLACTCKGFPACGFNPRTRVGCDASSSTNLLQGEEFQSTHPRGVRPPLAQIIPQPLKFQSTHPRGVRLPNKEIKEQEIQFQSTHPRGVRRHLVLSISQRLIVSIHAPAWGATTVFTHKTTRLDGFNPRTRVGCDKLGE